MSDLSNTVLFSAYKLGNLELPNRIVMAPMGRSRADEGGIPTPLMAEYYAQRATAGLIIAEATTISPEGLAYDRMPGIYTESQIAGWELVTHAVHSCGGRIFLQLCHVGRISHDSLEPGGRAPVAPSLLRANAEIIINGRCVDASEPRALELNEIREIVEAYVVGTRNALWAGFDGVEIHAGDGYLIDQFLRDGSNKRADEYGGSIENRTRFLAEVIQAVVEEAGDDCVGVRLSPVSTTNDAHDSHPVELFNHVIDVLDRLKPLYVHVIEGEVGNSEYFDPAFDFLAFRKRFHRTYIANNGFTKSLAQEKIAEGAADLVSFGVAFIANPDLVERFRGNIPLNAPDSTNVWGGGASGYTDYPTM
jgi:N-ethylmaleimide reductase